MLKRSLESLKKGANGELHDENQYIALINDILAYGEMVDGRNGNALTVFGSSMHFNLSDNTIPILTTKKVAWRTCAKELFWFIKGSTDNKLLQQSKGEGKYYCAVEPLPDYARPVRANPSFSLRL